MNKFVVKDNIGAFLHHAYHEKALVYISGSTFEFSNNNQEIINGDS